MHNKRIMSKIFKCLRLSESNNPNESAAAYRQAQRLMELHGIQEAQVTECHLVATATVSTHYTEPPYWIIALSELVARAFSCQAYVSRSKNNRAELYFIGVAHHTELSKYTFTVLQRLLSRERRLFIQSLDNIKKAEKTRRGDVFAQAWLFRITRTIITFIADPAIDAAIEAYVKQNFAVSEDFESASVTPSKEDIKAISGGFRAAEGVSLFRPVPSQNSTYAISSFCT